MISPLPAARPATRPDRQPRSSARSAYDRLSRWYDWLSRSERRLVDAGVQVLAVQAGESVLEIGPGTGHALEALARSAGARGRAAGLDLSSRMLARAGQRFARAGVERDAALVCGDAAGLPFPSGTFDAVFLSFALELFPDSEVPLVLAECRRALRSGGRIGVVSLSRQGGSRAMLRVYEWAHGRFPAWVDCRPIDAAHALLERGFRILAVSHYSLWGLGVQVALAIKAAA